jgi:hypothetical protein
MNMFTCPVCFYGEMPGPPKDYNICPCCGTEFENDDDFKTHAELRLEWITAGCRWFFRQPPPFWNPQTQLAKAYWGPIHYSTFGKTVIATGYTQVVFGADNPFVIFGPSDPVVGGGPLVFGNDQDIVSYTLSTKLFEDTQPQHRVVCVNEAEDCSLALAS